MKYNKNTFRRLIKLGNDLLVNFDLVRRYQRL